MYAQAGLGIARGGRPFVHSLLPRRRGLGYSTSATPPYFVADPYQTAQMPADAKTGLGPYNVASLDTYIQQFILQQLSDVAGFLTGGHGWASSASAIVSQFVAQAQQRCSQYPAICSGVDPVAVGTKYGNLFVSILSSIAAGPIAAANNLAPMSGSVLQNLGRGTYASSAPAGSASSGSSSAGSSYTTNGGSTSQTAAPSSAYGAAAGGAVSITDDVSGSSSQLMAGHAFTLRITGAAPNAPVSVNVGAWSNTYGNTDASGNFTLHDTVPNSPGTTQAQTWAVGGAPLNPSPLQFVILANPALPASTPVASGAAALPSAGGFDLSFLTNPISIFGYSVPLWMAGAVGVGAAWLLTSGGRGRH